MHDIRAIRDDPEAFDKGLERRGLSPIAAELIRLDAKWRTTMVTLQDLQARANTAASSIGLAIKSGETGQVEAFKQKSIELKRDIAREQAEERQYSKELGDALAVIPNLPLDEVPVGKDERHSVEVRRWGTPPEFAFQPREHFDIGE